MANLQTETIQLRVLIDGTPARKELAQLDQEFAKINADLRSVKKGTEEWVKGSARMDEITKRQTELRKEIGLTGLTAKQMGDEMRRLQIANRNLTPDTKQWAENTVRINALKDRLRELNDVALQSAKAWEVERTGIRLTDMSMNQLEKEARRLKVAMRDLNPKSGEFKKLRSELHAVDAQMAQTRSGLGLFGRAWQSVKSSVAGGFAVVGGLLAVGTLLNGIRNLVKGSAELSDAQADVRRTTGLTKAEMDKLSEGLSRMDTRTARTELLALAADAGKLGITGVQDVMKFVRAGDQIRVALGEDLGDDAIKAIGKLNQTFKVGEATGKDLEEQMLATGSAVNALGQASTAQEAFLVGYTTRLAGVNTQAGINIQNTLGYAAALDQLGQKEESSSTAMSQFTLKAFKNTAEYAKIAGMEVKEFTKLLKDDANEALLQVLEGLNGNNEGLIRMTALFDEMDQEGSRGVSTLASLASNTKLVREQQAIANAEFAKGTSITNEFNVRNATLGANLEIIGKKLSGAFVSSAFVDNLTKASRFLRDMVSPVISEGLEKERMEMQQLYAQILVTNEGSSARTKLIQELQAQYPQYLGNLNAETTSNQQLGAAVAHLNNQLIAKIVLQQKQEELDAVAKDAADQKMDRIEAEGKARVLQTELLDKYSIQLAGIEALAQAAEKSPVPFAPPTNLQEQLEYTRTVMRYLVKEGRASAKDLIDLGTAIQNAGFEKGLEQNFKKVMDGIAAEKERLRQELGVDDLTDGTSLRTDKTAPTTTDVVDPELDEKAKKAMDDARTAIARIREGIYQDGLAADEKALRQLDVKHAQELATLKANAQHTAEDITNLEANQTAVRIALIEEQGDKRVKAHAEADQRVRDILRGAKNDHLNAEVERIDALIALAEKGGESTVDLERRRRVALLRLYTANAQDAIVAEVQKWSSILIEARARLKDYDDLIAKGNASPALIAERQSMAEKIVELERAQNQAINNINEARRIKEIAAERAHTKALNAEEEKRLSMKLHTYQSIASAVAGLDGMLQAFHQNEGERAWADTAGAKVLALAQIAIETATAIAKAVSSSASGDPYSFAARVALVVAAVTSAIGQAYAVLSKASGEKPTVAATQAITPSDMPQGEKGLLGEPDGTIKTAKGGVFKGPSHNAGGLGVYDNNTGQQVAEVEGGEPWMVLSKAFREKNGGLIPELLRASAAGSRVDVARVPNVFSPVPAFNAKAANEAMNIVHMAQGGLLTARGGPAGLPTQSSTHGIAMVNITKPGGGGDGGTPPWAAAMLAEMRRSNRALEEFPTRLIAETRIGPDNDRRVTEWERIRGRNTISRKKVA